MSKAPGRPRLVLASLAEDVTRFFFVLALGLAIASPGCQCKSHQDRQREWERTESPTREEPAGGAFDASTPGAPEPDIWYRVVVTVEDSAEIPFFLGLSEGDDRAIIRNGEQRLEVEVVQRRDPLIVRVPVFGVRLRLSKDEETGRYTGKWLPNYVLDRDFELEAERVPRAGPEFRFFGEEDPVTNLSGNWRVDIHDFGVGRAVFRQDEAGNLGGSLIPPEIGDTRYMSGRLIGDRFALSAFDGIHAFLVEGTVEEGGARLEGQWFVGGFGSWKFTAERGDEPTVASLVSARLKEGAERVSIPELEKPAYKGHPVLVDLFGTWCPACMDLTPEIVDLRERYRDQGLKILSIALEPPGDKQAARRRLREFKEKYGVTWDIEVRYVEDFTEQIPPEIENALGFPVTIFVRRDGTVAGVHTAFVSDAARPEHRAVLRRFDEWAQEIVSSEPPAPPDAGPPAPKEGSR